MSPHSKKPKPALKHTLPAVIKIAVVDDQLLFRAGIVSLLKDFEEFDVVVQASHGKELLEKLKRHTPHVVLLDIEMPEMNGVETVIALRQTHPKIKIIILTMHNDEEFIFDLMMKGADGFLPKDKSVEEVVDANYAVMENGKYYNEQITQAMINGSKGLIKIPQLQDLTEKELQVVKLICKQKTNREIAEIMGINTRTIENYRSTVLIKTGAKNTAGLVLFALKHRIISKLDMI
jgi:DNA-binding NarL/FixJ family response regulator